MNALRDAEIGSAPAAFGMAVDGSVGRCTTQTVTRVPTAAVQTGAGSAIVSTQADTVAAASMGADEAPDPDATCFAGFGAMVGAARAKTGERGMDMGDSFTPASKMLSLGALCKHLGLSLADSWRCVGI